MVVVHRVRYVGCGSTETTIVREDAGSKRKVLQEEDGEVDRLRTSRRFEVEYSVEKVPRKDLKGQQF